MRQFNFIFLFMLTIFMSLPEIYAQTNTNPKTNTESNFWFPRPRPRPGTPRRSNVKISQFKQDKPAYVQTDQTVRIPIHIRLYNSGTRGSSYGKVVVKRIIGSSQHEVELTEPITYRNLSKKRGKSFYRELILPRSFENKTVQFQAFLRSKKSEILTIKLPTFKPDLVITQFSKTSTKNLPNGNVEVGFTASVKNQGNILATPSKLGIQQVTHNNTFSLNFNKSIGSLSVGSTVTLTGKVIIEREITPGNSTNIQAVADYCAAGSCAVQESNENNNASRKIGVSISGGPNIPQGTEIN